MAFEIPFDQETFRPLSIKGNAESDKPVEFDLTAVGGADRARLKSIIVASSGLIGEGWSPAVQEAVIKAFETGAPAFMNGVQGIRGLTVPAALAKKVGIIAAYGPGMDDKTSVPIVTGYEFSRVSGYLPVLAFEVGMQLAKLSANAEVDPRFFDSLLPLFGSLGILPGTAGRAESKPDASATAGSRTRRAQPRRSTSRRTP